MSGAVLGHDPGVNGGTAVLGLHTGAVLYLKGTRPDATDREMADEMGNAVETLELAGGGLAFVERVQHQSGDGAQGSFTFGGVYKFVLGCLHTRRVRVVGVYPQMWQARLECLTGGDKNVSLRRAKELFPAVFAKKMFKYEALRIADALLIAEYGRQITLRGIHVQT